MDIDRAYRVLRDEFDSLPRNSPKWEAAQVILETSSLFSGKEVRREFQEFIDHGRWFLMAYDMIKLRLYSNNDDEMPEDFRSDDIMQLTSEIDALAKRISVFIKLKSTKGGHESEMQSGSL